MLKEKLKATSYITNNGFQVDTFIDRDGDIKITTDSFICSVEEAEEVISIFKDIKKELKKISKDED